MLHGTLRGLYQFRIQGPYRVRFAWEDGQATHIDCGEFHGDS